MKTLAIVPARAGSRRMPLKNMTPLCGRPLLWWTLEEARKAESALSSVVVSTDDSEVMDFVRWQCEGTEILRRPAHLCRDDTPTWPVVEHALYEARREWSPDAVVLLQPTSPLRSALDIHTALGMLRGTGAEAVISFTDTEADAVYELGHAGRVRPLVLSQSATRFVSPNGAIFAMTTEAIDRGRTWWDADLVYAYVMPRERSLDIDTTGDLEAARAELGRRQACAA